jgi:hypothetical protein
MLTNLDFQLQPMLINLFTLVVTVHNKDEKYGMKNKESKRKSRHRCTWFDNVPTSTGVRLYSIMIQGYNITYL